MKPEGPRTQRMKIYSQSNRSGAPCQKLPHRRPSDSLQEQLFLRKFCQLHYIFSLGTGLCLHHTYLSSGKRKAAAAWPASDQQQHPWSHCRYRNTGARSLKPNERKSYPHGSSRSGQCFVCFRLCDFRKLSGRLSGRLLSGPQKSSADWLCCRPQGCLYDCPENFRFSERTKGCKTSCLSGALLL